MEHEGLTPHLALETLQQLQLETAAGHLDRREMSNHSLEGEWLGRQVVCATWRDLGPGGADWVARTECISLFPWSQRSLLQRVVWCAVPRRSSLVSVSTVGLLLVQISYDKFPHDEIETKSHYFGVKFTLYKFRGNFKACTTPVPTLCTRSRHAKRSRICIRQSETGFEFSNLDLFALG